MRYLENSSSSLALDFDEQISQGFREGLLGEQLQPQTLPKGGNIQVRIFFCHRFWYCGQVTLDTGVHKKLCWYNIKTYKYFWK